MNFGSPIGDLLRAWEHLRPGDPETRTRIAALLGLTLQSQTVQPVATTSNQTLAGSARIELPPEPAKPADKEPRRDILVETVPVQAEVRAEDVLGTMGLALPGTLPAFPPKIPLLNPRWTRGIFSGLLSLPAESFEIDVPKMVAVIASGEPVRRILFRKRFTVSAGVRCFNDAGAPMEIFVDDVWDIRRDLEALIGFERVSWQSFETVPDSSDVMFEPDSEFPAAPDSPVLILSDFGHYMSPGRNWALPEDWLEWVARERARGTACIVGLTPVDPVNWPAALRSEIQFVHWDIGTGIEAARRNAA